MKDKITKKEYKELLASQELFSKIIVLIDRTEYLNKRSWLNAALNDRTAYRLIKYLIALHGDELHELSKEEFVRAGALLDHDLDNLLQTIEDKGEEE